MTHKDLCAGRLVVDTMSLAREDNRIILEKEHPAIVKVSACLYK